MKKIRLKRVKNRSLDHIIDRDTDTKACYILLEYIDRHATGTYPIQPRNLSEFHKILSLTILVLCFLRRFPNIFVESPHPRFPSVNCFYLSDPGSLVLSRLSSTAATSNSHLELTSLLMLCQSRSLPLSTLFPFRFDLGLPHDFIFTFPSLHTNLFSISHKEHSSNTVMSLMNYPTDLPILYLQRRHLESRSYRNLKKPPSLGARLAFPMWFRRGYGGMNTVKAWMDFLQFGEIAGWDRRGPRGVAADVFLKEATCFRVSVLVNDVVQTPVLHPLLADLLHFY